MKIYRHRTVVKAPLKKVVDFHHQSQALKKLSPPFMFVSLNKVESLAEGSVVDFKMWLGPVPIRWVAVHCNVTPDSGFSDYQDQGPFKSWLHHHQFNLLDDYRTEIVDEIHAEPSDDLFWGLVSRFMWLNMPILFSYRAWVMQRELGS